MSNKVFIVHGRDENNIKDTIAYFLKELGLEPVILHEQPNEGRTIIEKFEDYSSVAYAVVLLTPDDLGGLASEKPELSLRSRQNVVFELGYFIGKLGRKKVCALCQKGVELPSDFHGVLYVPLDETGEWQSRLKKELEAVGLNIDLSKVV
ncbi:nucleotide-binding protein [Patescibacteria group bacterium]|nr:nucleotide-binding protein [Patescibacteria group bacterium]